MTRTVTDHLFAHLPSRRNRDGDWEEDYERVRAVLRLDARTGEVRYDKAAPLSSSIRKASRRTSR